MSKALGKWVAWSLSGALAGILIATAPVQAEVSTDLSGSIVIFPKVVSDGTRDTVIQLSNTDNSLTHVRCFYINASNKCQVTDFELWLTRQQPTHWVASQGRPVNPSDGFGNDGSGLDAGAIPPVAPGFAGELKCIAVGASGFPLASNNLKGEAVLRDSSGDVSKYSAVSILAAGGISDDHEIRLNNAPDSADDFDGGIEANSCVDTILLNHFADGVTDPVLLAIDPDSPVNNGDPPTVCPGVCSLNSDNAGTACTDDAGCTGANASCYFQCPIRTTLTLVPCSEDLENLIPSTVTVQMDVTNELEQHFSASTTVDCWLDEEIGNFGGSLTGRCSASPSTQCTSDADCTGNNDGFCVKQGPFSAGVLGTLTAYTRITPSGLDGGVIAIAEESHQNGAGSTARAAWNLQAEGDFFDVEGHQRFMPVTRVGTTGVVDVIHITE